MRPRLTVYSTNRDLTTQCVIRFAQGVSRSSYNWDVKFQQIDRYRKNGFKGIRPGVDAVASLGILRGTGEMFKEAQKLGLDYFYMDHAYFNPGYKGQGWLRITKNNHSMNYLHPATNKRFNNLFLPNNPIMPWLSHRNRGRLIIICPPTHAVGWYVGIDTDRWTQDIVDQLKQILPPNEHDRIVIRHKPNEPVVDQKGNLLKMKQNPIIGNLTQDLSESCCVIAYNSMVALTATMLGIPVIVSENSCCYPISFKVQDFSTPSVFNNEPNRQQLFNWLAQNQWNAKEMSDGTAWTQLMENSNGI